MQQILLVQDNGYMEPPGNLYHDISKGTWKYAWILIASSVCMNGPAPNIFASRVYKNITDGSAGVLENIPEKLLGTTAAIRFYNEVSLRFLYTFFKSITIIIIFCMLLKSCLSWNAANLRENTFITPCASTVLK